MRSSSAASSISIRTTTPNGGYDVSRRNGSSRSRNHAERAARERLDDVVLRLPRLDEEPPARCEHPGELVQRLQRDLRRAEVRTRQQLVEIGDDNRAGVADRVRGGERPDDDRRAPSGARPSSPSRSGRPARRPPSRSRVRRARVPSPRSESAPPQYGHSSGAAAVAPHTRQRRFGRSNARPAPQTSHAGAQPQSVHRSLRTSPRRPTNTSASEPLATADVTTSINRGVTGPLRGRAVSGRTGERFPSV